MNHNEQIIKELEQIWNQIEEAEEHVHELKAKLKAPCKKCKYDGVYRCEACEDDLYRGFNIADYPKY